MDFKHLSRHARYKCSLLVCVVVCVCVLLCSNFLMYRQVVSRPSYRETASTFIKLLCSLRTNNNSTHVGKFHPRETKNLSNSLKKKMKNEKLIIIYKIPHYRRIQKIDDTIYCSKRISCRVSSNCSRTFEADAIVVNSFLIKKVDPKPKRFNSNQVWVFHSKEPWINYKHRIPLKQWDSIFNWTMTYQSNSDIHLPYNKLINVQASPHINWIDVMANKTRTALWFVSNCHSNNKREIYVKELMKYINIDIIGGCGEKTCGVEPSQLCWSKYRFYLAFENSNCKDYITEKYYGTFKHNIVPVVRGHSNLDKQMPTDSYINTADFNSPKDLAFFLLYLENNPKEYLRYLKRHAQFQIASAGNGLCQICKRLQNLNKYRRWYPSVSAFMECYLPKNPLLW